eukprot:2613550-Pyramimonas_sp.AAC.1
MADMAESGRATFPVRRASHEQVRFPDDAEDLRRDVLCHLYPGCYPVTLTRATHGRVALTYAAYKR